MDLNERVAALEKDNENIHTELSDIKKQNQAIFKIATSVEIMAKDLQGLKEDVGDVKNGQQLLGDKLDNEIERVKSKQNELRDKLEAVDHKDAKKAQKILSDIGGKLLWLVVGAFAAFFLYQAFPMLNT